MGLDIPTTERLACWADSNGRRNTLIRSCWSGTSAKLGYSGDRKAGDAIARASTGGES